VASSLLFLSDTMVDDSQGCARPKTSLVSRGLVKDVLGVLVLIAEAVPILGAPVRGSLEALKQIIEYTQVSSRVVALVRRVRV
jgi:hypothetical protein